MTTNIAPANRSMPPASGWQDRHDAAMCLPRPGFESAIVQMLNGWHQYAATHRANYESLMGDDGVLGPEWQAIGKGLLGLLNGDLGRMDGGTLDAFLRNTMAANGVDVES